MLNEDNNMFTHPPIVDVSLLDAISKLKIFFTSEEETAWKMMRALTTRAIQNFKEGSAESKADVFVLDSGDLRDRNCDVNFTIVSVAVILAKSPDAHPVILANAVKAIPNALKELSDDLTVFLKNDTSVERKEKYNQAINYLKKVEACCSSLKIEKDQSSSPTV